MKSFIVKLKRNLVVPSLEAQDVKAELDEGHGRLWVHELDEVAQSVRVRQDIVERLGQTVGPFSGVDCKIKCS